MRKILFGACILDDPGASSPGWASIAGEDPTRINGVNELPHDIFWVTNLNYRVYKKYNLDKLPHILDEQYFRTSIKNIGQEIGALSDGRSLSQFCSRVFQNTLDEASSIIGRDAPVHRYRFFSGIADILAPSAIRRVPSHASGHQIRQAMKESTQANQVMFGVRPPLGSSPYPFVIPRSSYFEWMMDQEYPSCEGWKEIKDKDVKASLGTKHGRMVRGTRAVIDNLVDLSKNKALFLKVSVKSTDPFYRDFSTFGSGSNYMRGYASLPEIMNLARFSSLEISGGYSCNTFKLDELGMSYAANMFRYSRGLALENIFAALANPIGGDRGGNYNGLAAYLRAYDRIVCQRHAEILAKAGVTIGSFGTGKVIGYCKSHEADFIDEAAMDARLIPPLSLREVM